MRHPRLADIGCSPEGGEMGAHQRREIDRDPRDGKRKGHPPVTGDPHRRCPVRRDGDQITHRKPDADIGHHAQDHGDRGQGKAEKRKPLIVSGILKQYAEIVLFLFVHRTTFLFSPFRSRTVFQLVSPR